MEPTPNWRADLPAFLRAPQEPQACPHYSVLGAKAAEAEMQLTPNWRAHLPASLRTLQEPEAGALYSVLGAEASEV